MKVYPRCRSRGVTEITVRWRASFSRAALAPSRAVGFVYGLRGAVRAELGEALASRAHAEELAALERRVEALALRAFDLYVAMRDQMARLRQAELRRSVSSLLRRWYGGAIPEPPPDVVQLGRPSAAGMRR